MQSARPAASDIAAEGKQFAADGGLAVSVRAELRFTRDVQGTTGQPIRHGRRCGAGSE